MTAAASGAAAGVGLRRAVGRGNFCSRRRLSCSSRRRAACTNESTQQRQARGRCSLRNGWAMLAWGAEARKETGELTSSSA